MNLQYGLNKPSSIQVTLDCLWSKQFQSPLKLQPFRSWVKLVFAVQRVVFLCLLIDEMHQIQTKGPARYLQLITVFNQMAGPSSTLPQICTLYELLFRSVNHESIVVQASIYSSHQAPPNPLTKYEFRRWSTWVINHWSILIHFGPT
jgi:hypothetical protein